MATDLIIRTRVRGGPKRDRRAFLR